MNNHFVLFPRIYVHQLDARDKSNISITNRAPLPLYIKRGKIYRRNEVSLRACANRRSKILSKTTSISRWLYAYIERLKRDISKRRCTADFETLPIYSAGEPRLWFAWLWISYKWIFVCHVRISFFFAGGTIEITRGFPASKKSYKILNILSCSWYVYWTWANWNHRVWTFFCNFKLRGREIRAVSNNPKGIPRRCKRNVCFFFRLSNSPRAAV